MAESTLVVQLGPAGLSVPGKPGATRIFHEFDPAHPNGEALVVAGRKVTVGDTMRVREALARRLLEQVAGPADPDPVQVVDVIDQQGAEAGATAAAKGGKGK